MVNENRQDQFHAPAKGSRHNGSRKPQDFMGKTSHGHAARFGHSTGQLRKSQEQKRKEAEARNAAWQKLTPIQQLKFLDKKFGKGLGAPNQRKRLAAILSKTA